MTHLVALFILGHAGVGKSFLTSRFVQAQKQMGQAWCVLDKDVVSECWSGPLLQALGHDPDDRDSPAFKAHVRDLGYLSTLRVARDQLELGLNVVFPGPWNRELASGALFSAVELGLAPDAHLRHVWLDLPESIRRERIIQRADPRDAWKLEHWDTYIKGLQRPDSVDAGSVPALDASLPIQEQLMFLNRLVAT